MPPPPPGGVHGYVPPPAPGGGSGAPPAKNKLPMIIGGVLAVIAIVGVLIAIMASRGDGPTSSPTPPKTTEKNGSGPGTTARSGSDDAAVVAGIKVLFPGANGDEQSCMIDGFSNNTDAIVAVGKKGGTSGDSTEASDLAEVVTSCVTTDRMAAAVLPNIAQEYQQAFGTALTQADLACAQDSLSQLPISDFKSALESYYQTPPVPFTQSFNDALVSCGG